MAAARRKLPPDRDGGVIGVDQAPPFHSRGMCIGKWGVALRLRDDGDQLVVARARGAGVDEISDG